MDPRERNRLKRERMEKNRQRFRVKVEKFYKEFYPDKWEIARDLLFVKYGTNFKEFNVKLIEKYGDAFKNYKVGEVKIKTSKELQEERVRQAALLNGDIDEDDVMEEQPDLQQDNGLLPCNTCGRSFAQDRIAKHEDICTRRAERNKSKDKTAKEEVAEVDKPQREESRVELNSAEKSEIEQLEEQLKLLKMLKAQKQQAKK
jgi:hypothetical protein